MGAFTGTGALVRLALRRDRIKLPVWVASITLLLAMSASANVEFYGTAAERMAYATTTATSMVSRIMGGPITGADMGSIIMLENFLIVAVLAAFMSTLAIIRHTRQNEETGRSELIGSAVVGRHSSMLAAFIVVTGANILLGALCALALIGLLGSEYTAGALAYGAAVTGTGLAFAGIAAVAAQITEGARAANGIAAAAIGVTFLIRGVGDALGTVAASGTEVTSHWLSWLSPFGWGFFMKPFVENHWWVLGLFAGLIVLSIWVAVLMADRRDVGAGMVATRKGPALAARSLLSPLGLAWRLQRGIFVGWLVTMVVVGVGFGVSGKEFKNFFAENEQLADALARIGADNLIDGLFSALVAYLGVMTVGYMVQALLRMRSEETGPLESVLATGVSRYRWMLSHITVAFAGTVVLVVVSGVLMALAYGLAVGDTWGEFSDIAQGALVQIPALLTMGGFVALIFALVPRMAVAFGWGAFIVALLLEQLGLMLDLPQWVINISPFTHAPAVPAVNVNATPLLILSAVALGLTLSALALFRRRNITTS
jgi:ABC-2 type transport system permease protein